MFKNLFKYSLNVLAVLTGFAFLVFAAFPNTSSVIESAASWPALAVVIAVILVIWAFLMLIISTVLLFSETRREQAFLMTSRTEVRDELEEKAVSDAIKRTFIFNLALLSFLFAASGFSYTHFETEKGKSSMSFGYALWQEDTTETKEAITKIINNLPVDKKAKLKEKGISIEVTDSMVDNAKYLLPRKFLSSFGILCLILIQFIAFKLFLFLNLRKLNSEDED